MRLPDPDFERVLRRRGGRVVEGGRAVPADDGAELVASLQCRSRHWRRASASWGFVPVESMSRVSHSRTRSSLRRRTSVFAVATVRSTEQGGVSHDGDNVWSRRTIIVVHHFVLLTLHVGTLPINC